jgi:hypothetical protein
MEIPTPQYWYKGQTGVGNQHSNTPYTFNMTDQNGTYHMFVQWYSGPDWPAFIKLDDIGMPWTGWQRSDPDDNAYSFAVTDAIGRRLISHNPANTYAPELEDHIPVEEIDPDLDRYVSTGTRVVTHPGYSWGDFEPTQAGVLTLGAMDIYYEGSIPTGGIEGYNIQYLMWTELSDPNLTGDFVSDARAFETASRRI